MASAILAIIPPSDVARHQTVACPGLFDQFQLVYAQPVVQAVGKRKSGANMIGKDCWIALTWHNCNRRGWQGAFQRNRRQYTQLPVAHYKHSLWQFAKHGLTIHGIAANRSLRA
jgi:hypothetical protein